jgi:hypothetical protein
MGCGSSSNTNAASSHETPAAIAATSGTSTDRPEDVHSKLTALQSDDDLPVSPPPSSPVQTPLAAEPELKAGGIAPSCREPQYPPPMRASIPTIAGVNTPSDIAAIIESAPKAHAENIFGFGKCSDEAKPGKGKFVIYFMVKVRLESPTGVVMHTTVYRRYSQFELLREKLLREKKKYGGNIPVLPKKKYFGALRNLDFLNERQHDLDTWLRAVNRLPSVDESEYYNLFLMEEADDAPPQFVVLKTVDSIGLAQILAAVDDTFSDDESEMSETDSEEWGSGNDVRTKPPCFDRAIEGGEGIVVSGLPPLPPIIEDELTLVPDTEPNAAAVVATVGPMVGTTRSPSIRAAFELGAKRTPKIFFDGISSFGTGADTGAKLRKKSTLYYVLKIRYTDERKNIELDIRIYRRYSEFEKLRANLLISNLHGDIPLLPKKKLFGRTNRNNDHAMQRKEQLQEWLCKVAAYPHICSDEYYKAFVLREANKMPDNFILDECFIK